jgi:DNA-binding MarR family transcriptional regulator
MTNWLSHEQQEIWRSWLSATSLLPDQLGRDLQQDSGLTNADYEILVKLSEAADQKIRMSDLAERTLSSRSRLSHQIDRMEKSGFVIREECPDDRRGSFAVLTDTGQKLLVSAAPAHVESVRRHLVDILTPEEFESLGKACTKVSNHLKSLTVNN